MTGQDDVGRRPPSAGGATSCAARFEVRYTRFLDEKGKPVDELPELARDPEQLMVLYRHMVLTRAFDAKAIALQRTGQLGTYPASLGQEGVSTGIGAAMLAEDVLIPSYRETGTHMWRGVSMADILLYWGGDERGMAYTGGPQEDFPICVPVASHTPQAVGVAFAIAHRGERRAVVCVLGDGATSKGDFYEALNMAGVWDLPLVFVINNNQWAISVPRTAQSRAETLAQKAIAGGFEGEQVDGNDVIAVRHCIGAALEHARAGKGPRLVEALTYRIADHTTSDDAGRYRSQAEVDKWKRRDPIARLRAYLVAQGHWSEGDEQALAADCSKRVEAEVRRYLDAPPQPREVMFDYLFARLPGPLAAQRAALAALAVRGDT